MSEGSDQEEKPTIHGVNLATNGSERPRRATRREVDYRNSGEGGPSDAQSLEGQEEKGVVGRDTVRQTNARELRGSSTESVWGDSSKGSWSPQTVQRRTNTLAEGLQEVQQQLDMAKKEESSVAELMKMMLEMSNRDKEEARKREEEREERAIIREEKRLTEQADRENERRRQEDEREDKRLQEIRDREEDRRREENIREERRIEREERERQVAAEREVQLIATLKAAQPAVPQTVHLESTKLPVMTKGEDVQVFLELFESALVAGGVPEAKWLPKLHASLDTETKLTIKETITNPLMTYDDVKTALVGQTHLTFAAASESLMTMEHGAITKLPIRQAVQKVARLFEKLTTEAVTMREMCLYSAVAVTRAALSREAKQYVDVKGSCECNSFCCSLEEWQRTNPGRPVWDSRGKYNVERPVFSPRQPFRTPGQTRKSGECFYCGKAGHFAAECRSRPAGERQPFFRQDTPTPTQQPAARPEGPKPTRGVQRSLADTTCFHCQQRGHISPNCPAKKKIKKVRVMQDRIASLKNNEMFGAVGPHRMPITLDTGAEVTVVPAEAVEPHQLNGETKTLRSFNNGESTGNVCIVDISIGDKSFRKQAVTQPGESLGWSVCLCMDLSDLEERTFLTNQIAARAGMPHSETLYVPPEVRDGILVSGVPVSEAKVVKAVKHKEVTNSGGNKPVQAAGAEATPQEETPQLTQEESSDGPVQSTTVEVREDTHEQTEEADDDEDVVRGTVEGEENLVTDEESGSASEGSAESEDIQELPVTAIREGMPRDEMAQETSTDVSLKTVLSLARLDREGYHVSQGLVFRTRLDIFGKPVEQLCVPSSYRHKCLQAAHTSFGHQGRNKMITLLRPHFYWPCMARDCVRYIRSCSKCQANDKSLPKPPLMTPREVVTRPFRDVAIDIVGPFPNAKGGFRFMLTCVDTASRWPEAFPLRSTTSRTVIGHLTQIFTRWGFPSKLTSDNGPQFTSSIFKKWLKKNGIAHARATPYHPQANGIVERLHRTLNGVIAKTIECKGDWASVLPMALFFLRCTPSSSTGISPFLLTHGWEPSNPIQLLYKSWVDEELGGVDLSEWVLDNSDRVEAAREQATLQLIENSIHRTEMFNKKAMNRQFLVGDRVWVRRPGLDHKLRESWVGPGTVVKANSPCSFRVQTPDRLIPTVHVQQLKLAESESIKRITTIVQDTEQEDLTTSFATANIQTQELSREQQLQLSQMLGELSAVLTTEPGLTDLASFNIDTGDADPIQQRPYSTPVALKAKVDEELEWLLGKGYIVPSSSPWASPMVTVRKADGSARLCVDFRKINSLTRPMPFFMPRVEEVVEGIGKARYISKLDLAKGFYQVPLTPRAMAKTAFTCHKGNFQFTRMPFGVKNAPACFQILMQRILGDITEFSTAYMDDVVIFSPT